MLPVITSIRVRTEPARDTGFMFLRLFERDGLGRDAEECAGTRTSSKAADLLSQGTDQVPSSGV